MTWYLVRSTGMVAYALLTASMLWGLWLSTRTPAPQGRPWVLEVHQALGALGVIFLLGHLTSLLADSYVHFGWTDVLLPFASDWNPVAVAWGIVAGYLLMAVQVTSLLRRSLTRKSWRKVHLASFGSYLLASAHFLTAGSDSGNRFVLASILGSFTVVALGTIYRITQHLSRPAARPTPPKETAPWTPTPPAPTMPPGPPPIAELRPLVSLGAPQPSAPPPLSPPVR
jgi:methionine sulfoxide reductase heme-binding subunit